MAIQTYDDRSGGFYAHLVDGHLPDRSVLTRRAEEIADEIEALSKDKRGAVMERQYITNLWDSDRIFEYIAYNLRGMFHRNVRSECSGYKWSEAWLVNPEHLDKGYKLKEKDENYSNRRFLITLYDGCKYGKTCLDDVVEKSGLEVISEDKYKDINAFREAANHLLDEVATPFLAPCIIAKEKLWDQCGPCRGFGN